MKTQPRKLTLVGALCSMLFCASTLLGQNIGQWEFNTDLSATAGSNLGPINYVDGPTSATSNDTHFGSTTFFGIPNINGSVAQVMKYSGNATLPTRGYLMPTPPANGGGSLVNDYTIIFDVLFPTNGIFRPLIQMDNGALDNIQAYLAIAVNDSVAITNTSGSQLPSGLFGHVGINTWYRLGFVVSTDTGEVDVYTNGVPLGVVFIGANQIDGAYALFAGDTNFPPVLPVFTSPATNTVGYVNSLQLRDTALNPGQMEALGGPSAAGIPITIPPVPSFIAARNPGLQQAGISPTPAIHVVINQGDTTVNFSSITLAFDGTVIPAVLDNPSAGLYTADYQET